MRLEWDEERYSTGQPIIDRQHRAFMDRANLFLELSEEGVNLREFTLALDFLKRYALQHFVYEERLERPGPDSVNRHEHAEFLEHLEELSRDLRRRGPDPDLVASLCRWLVHWYDHHIGDVDQDIDY